MPEEIPDVVSERTKILFVCSRNRRRSLTAETIFKSELAWEVRSAGTEESARIKVTAGHLGWADVIVVMEKRHNERLRQKNPEELAAKPCVCLFISDDYEFMDARLIELLREKMQEHFPTAPVRPDSAA
jgi:predicted protein tyrosine phosphatase